MASASRLSLDVAADTHEDLMDWVKKIREAAQTADARVSLESPWQWSQLQGFPGCIKGGLVGGDGSEVAAGTSMQC